MRRIKKRVLKFTSLQEVGGKEKGEGEEAKAGFLSLA